MQITETDRTKKKYDSGSKCKLFLGGLNNITNEDGLGSHFEKYGEINDLVVMKFPDTRRSRGFGFVTFSKDEEAETCYKDCPHIIDGKTIELKRATPKGEMYDKDRGKGDRDAESYRKVFIGGLSYQTDDASLKSYFSQFGTLVDSIVMKFRDTKRSRGFGFVTYATETEVNECQRNRPHKIDGKVVETKRATPREDAESQRGKSVTRLFVGGLKHDEISNDDMKDYFGKFGNVISVEQMTEKSTGKKRGFGFVEFDDYDCVDKVLLEQNISIKGFRLSAEKSMPKGNENYRKLKRKYEESGYDNRGNRNPSEPWYFDSTDANFAFNSSFGGVFNGNTFKNSGSKRNGPYSFLFDYHARTPEGFGWSYLLNNKRTPFG